jgi:hypothetical protein
MNLNAAKVAENNEEKKNAKEKEFHIKYDPKEEKPTFCSSGILANASGNAGAATAGAAAG